MFVWHFANGVQEVRESVGRTCRVFAIGERRKLLATFALPGDFELL